MEIKKAVENYLRSVKIKNGDPTYCCYLSHLNTVLNFCSVNNFVVIDDLKNDFYLKFVDYSFSNKNCSKTINKRLRLFIKALKFNKIFNAFDYESLKESKKRFDIVSDLDLKKIINYIYKLDDSIENISNKLLILLLVDTGARINEILHIKKTNIDFSRNKILLDVTKTKRERIVYFNLYTRELLLKILSYDYSSDYLLYNFKKNKNYTYDCVRYFLKKIKNEVNLNHIHPHMFRHTFITNLINNGAPVFFVQQLAGHESIKTTQIYVHLIDKKLEDIYKKYSNYSI